MISCLKVFAVFWARPNLSHKLYPARSYPTASRRYSHVYGGNCQSGFQREVEYDRIGRLTGRVIYTQSNALSGMPFPRSEESSKCAARLTSRSSCARRFKGFLWIRAEVEEGVQASNDHFGTLQFTLSYNAAAQLSSSR